MDISPKKIYRQLINTWKDAQCRSLLEKCKSKLQWDITSHWSGWSSSKSLQTINAGEGVMKREPLCTVGGNVNWYSHYGRQYGDSLKTRNKTTIWPSNPIPRHRPWGNQNWERHMYPYICCSTITIATTWKQPRCTSTDEWIKKLWYINTMEYYSAMKRNSFESVLIKWMNLEPIIQSEVSQKEKR